jgi:tetratricopeptide (TPR) repeat protein
MLDLLLFAYVIRCLLEHRIHEQPSWLDRATLLFGVGMANNWGLIGFLPLFVAALLRTKRLSFFSLSTLRRLEQSQTNSLASALSADLRFFLRMALLGLAGASLFFLLPLVQAFSPVSSLSFWQSLKTIAASDKANLQLLFSAFFRSHRELALLLAASSFLPVLLLSFRWRAFASAGAHARFDLAAFILQLSHAFLLLICLWTVFDPPFSPRRTAAENGLPLPFLPLYYLTALSIGYYSGFFLLLFGAAARQGLSRRYAFRRLLCRVVPTLVYVLLGVTLPGLLLLNFPVIRAGNASHLDRYARLAAGSLPPEGAVVLSDDPVRLAVLQAALAREGKAGRYVPVDTQYLASAPYHAWLNRRYPGRWSAPGTPTVSPAAGLAVPQASARLDAASIVRLLSSLAQSNHVYYLKASFGSYLDPFYLQPHGLLLEKSYPLESLTDPPLATTELAENQAFWQQAIEAGIRPLLPLASQTELPRPEFAQLLMKLARLRTPPPAQVRRVAGWYSAALNRWGVMLQRNSRWSDATPLFTLAQELNPDNLPARVNLQCNSNLLAHQKMMVAPTDAFPDQFGGSRSLLRIVTDCGPFDEPTYCYYLALNYAGAGLLLPACQQLERVKALVPGDVSVQLLLGEFLNRVPWPDYALKVAAGIRADPALRPLGPANEVELGLLEARAWLAKTNRPMAQGIIYALLGTHPGDARVLERAVATFTACRSYSDALRIVDRQLQSAPKDPVALANKGILCVLTGDFSNAIPSLTLSLSLTNTYGARLNRAIAWLRTGRPDAAEADYQALLQAFPAAHNDCLELVGAAVQIGNTNAAIRYCEQYLAQAGADTDEAKALTARLKSLRQGRH